RRHGKQHIVFGDVGVAGFDQPLDQRPHLADVLGGARLDGRRQAAERVDVVVKLLVGFFGDLADRLIERQAGIFLGGAGVDLVVDVGDVAHIGDVVGAGEMAQQPEQHIEHDHRPRIADMGEVVNRGATDIHPHVLGIERNEVFLGLGQGIEQAQSHDRSGEAVRETSKFWASRRVFAGLAANRNPDNEARSLHAVFPSRRARDRSRPIRGNSFLSSGPCSSPVNARRRGWNRPRPLAPVSAATALVQAPQVSSFQGSGGKRAAALVARAASSITGVTGPWINRAISGTSDTLAILGLIASQNASPSGTRLFTAPYGKMWSSLAFSAASS